MEIKKRRFKSLLNAVLIILIAVIVSANYRPIQEKIHIGIYWVYEQNETVGDALFAVNRIIFNGTNFDRERLTKHAIYKSYPSVVLISTQSAVPGNLGGGTGTGFFIKVNDTDAYIVTNNHVIGQAYVSPALWNVTVNTATDMWSYEAEIVGVDEVSDIAVLKILKKDNEEWEAMEWETSTTVGVGSPITVLGHGMSLPWTATSGIISYNGRFGSRPYNLMLQIDAVINQGNSGGPVLSSSGKVIGIAESILSPGRSIPGWDGVGMAVSSEQAQRSIKYILSPQYVSKGYVPYARYPFNLGTFTIDDVKDIPEKDRYYSYFDYTSQEDDATVTIGQESGLLQGDILLKLNGEDVRTSWTIMKKIVVAFPGDEWTVTVKREDKILDIVVVLREMDRDRLLSSLNLR